jgi:hypothetical protein
LAGVAAFDFGERTVVGFEIVNNLPRLGAGPEKYQEKSVSRGLSAEQADLMKQAISNQRKMDALIEEIRALTQKLILALARKPRKRAIAKHPQTALS